MGGKGFEKLFCLLDRTQKKNSWRGKTLDCTWEMIFMNVDDSFLLKKYFLMVKNVWYTWTHKGSTIYMHVIHKTINLKLESFKVKSHHNEPPS